VSQFQCVALGKAGYNLFNKIYRQRFGVIRSKFGPWGKHRAIFRIYNFLFSVL